MSPATRGSGSARPARRPSASRSARPDADGRYYKAKDLRLHTLPERRPPIWVSAFGPQAAEVAGRRGDRLWTLPDPESTPGVIEAWRAGGGEGEVVFQALFSWAETDEAAFDAARRWKGAR